ncbi:MAG: LysE family transporter [Labilithrix sp.]|nr:LysE family transporter [Labilithrix sp.]MCW5817173.1 LysE family transporter [Labilithrix sp.]
MALPGPSGVMVVTRAIEGRFTEARKIGLGAALPEATYAGIAFASSSSLLDAHPSALPIVRALTSIVLIAVGATFVRWRPQETPGAAPASGRARGAFALGFFTALFNPVAIVTWATTAGVLTSRGLLATSYALGLPFGLGVVAGINGWYAILLVLMTRYHDRIPRRFFTWLIRGIGGFLIASGSWTAFGVLRNLIR